MEQNQFPALIHRQILGLDTKGNDITGVFGNELGHKFRVPTDGKGPGYIFHGKVQHFLVKTDKGRQHGLEIGFMCLIIIGKRRFGQADAHFAGSLSFSAFTDSQHIVSGMNGGFLQQVICIDAKTVGNHEVVPFVPDASGQQ